MKEIIQGIIIGIGKIIPGVSGSIIAINLGIYEKAINCITHFFSDFKNNVYYLGKLGIGIIISISLLSGIIVYFLNNYYIVTMFLFIGLIIGSSKKNKKHNKYNYISLISFSMVLGLVLITKPNTIQLNNTIIKFLYFVLIGLVDAATMIIPGISGTAILMMMGAYDLIINTYSSLFIISQLYTNLKVLIPFGLGIMIGIYLTSRMINYCFNKFQDQTYSAIKGLQWGTIVYMIFLCLKQYSSIIELMIGFLVCILGLVSIKKINHFL